MLTLNVPGTDAVQQHPPETRPKAVAEWLARLPFASPADTAQQLVMALHALNRHPLSADDRHALLALYRPVLARAAASLEVLHAETGVPPQAQQRQTGMLLCELHIEHSIGYKQLLLALTNRRFSRANPRRVAEVTARLLAALRDIQTACYLSYTPPPAGLWQEMHQIHTFALTAGLAGNAVDDAPAASLAYRQALLIALADPPRLNHAELIHTRLYLDSFAVLARLVAAPVAGHHGFPIRTDGDAAPSAFPAGPTPGGLWLDTDALCRHLHDSAIRLRTGETPRLAGLPPGMQSELSQALFRRLLKQWGNGVQRAFPRYPTRGSTVQIVATVSAIHRLLEPAPAAGQAPDEADSVSIQDVESQLAAPVAVNITQWSVINDSATGFALSGTPDAPLNLKVGNPLALRADAEAEWSLGVVRWLRMRDARQVELGVERLSPQIKPVWVRPLRGGHPARPEPALFVPGLAALKQNDRLLLPRHLYQIGMSAEVVHTAHPYTVTFGRRQTRTPSFDLVDFTLLTHEQP
ncbi:MAG: hypothetical protein ACYCY9_11815 [Thiobacillus sp.]